MKEARKMKFAAVTYDDLTEIRHLQPEGWPDIVKDFKFYLMLDSACPLKKYPGPGLLESELQSSWVIQPGSHTLWWIQKSVYRTKE